jgi:hypothetical protein
VIVSYQSRSSEFILVSVWLRCSMLSRMCLVCVTGMLEYVCDVEGSKVGVGVMGVFCSP